MNISIAKCHAFAWGVSRLVGIAVAWAVQCFGFWAARRLIPNDQESLERENKQLMRPSILGDERVFCVILSNRSSSGHGCDRP